MAYFHFVLDLGYTLYITSDEISHEPIISEELFQKAQMKLKDRRLSVAPSVGKPAKYILSSILRCPMCGGPMVSELPGLTEAANERFSGIISVLTTPEASTASAKRTASRRSR